MHILFGRLFSKTANTKIDYGKDTLYVEVGDEVIGFNFYNVMKYPYNNVYSITYHDQIDECVQQVLDIDYNDGLSMVLRHDIDFTEINNIENIYVLLNVQESTLALQTAPYGNVFVDLLLSHKKFSIYFIGTQVRIETFVW